MYTFLRKVAPNLVDNAHVSQPLNEQPNRERDTNQPFRGSRHDVGIERNARHAMARRILLVDRSSRQIPRIDLERPTADLQREARRGVAGQGETTVAVRRRTGNRGMDLLGVSLRREDVRRARVENASAMPEPHVDVVERECVDVALPEADLRYVGDGDEGRGIVLGGVHAAKGDRPIMFAISDAGDLV